MSSALDAVTQDDLESLTRDQLRDPFPEDIGGGDGYDPAEYDPFPEWASGERVTPDDADVFVTNFEELDVAREELNGAGGGVIWLDTDEIDATSDGGDNILEDNITIASGRGMDGQPTCTVKADRPDKFFKVHGNNCRLSGFRINGGDTEYVDPRDHPEWGKHGGDAIYAMGTSEGIVVRGDFTQIDNMVIRGMTHTGILIERENAALTPEYKTFIHHGEYIDNPTETLGYGITVKWGSPIITKGFFDHNRHSIAADGAKNCHYVLSESIIGPKGNGDKPSHAIDMHGKDPGDEGYHPLDQDIPDKRAELRKRRQNADTEGIKHAGGRVSVHHNVVFPIDRTGFKVRGCPRLGAQIHSNFFFNPPNRQIPRGTGEDGLAYSIRAKHLTADEVGVDSANNLMTMGDPTASLGPGFSDTNSEEAKQLKDRLQEAQKEIQTLKPKADAADEVAGAFSRLSKLSAPQGDVEATDGK